MKSILQMITAKFRPKIEYVGKSGNGVCYHVTMRPNATEDDIYACREAIQSTGYTTLIYHTEHKGTPHIGVFSQN